MRALLAVQGAFCTATGLWPLIHLHSFLGVTGRKSELWLLYALSLLITVIGVVLVAAAGRRRVAAEVVLLAVASALH